MGGSRRTAMHGLGWFACCGAFAALWAAGCSFVLGDVTVPPPSGAGGGGHAGSTVGGGGTHAGGGPAGGGTGGLSTTTTGGGSAGGQPPLPSCMDQYGGDESTPAVCVENGDTCVLLWTFLSPTRDCAGACTSHGGECFANHLASAPPSCPAGAQIGCDQSEVDLLNDGGLAPDAGTPWFLCACSRGCGGHAACDAGTCSNGQCL